MRKSAEAFRTISEVADLLDVPAHVLRFWESRFTQISPLKRGGGRRYYRPADVDLLRGIQQLLYEDGLTIKGAQKVLKSKGVKHVSALAQTAALPETPAASETPVTPETPVATKTPVVQTPPNAQARPNAPDTEIDLKSIVARLQQLRGEIIATL